MNTMIISRRKLKTIDCFKSVCKYNINYILIAYFCVCDINVLLKLMVILLFLTIGLDLKIKLSTGVMTNASL